MITIPIIIVGPAILLGILKIIVQDVVKQLEMNYINHNIIQDINVLDVKKKDIQLKIVQINNVLKNDLPYKNQEHLIRIIKLLME